eukprot:1266277-Prymnesium_polylepis.1
MSARELARLLALACCRASVANGAASPSYTAPQSFGGVLGPAAVRARVRPPSSTPWLASGVPRST